MEWYVCLSKDWGVTCTGGFNSAIEADDYYNDRLSKQTHHMSSRIPIFKYQPNVLKQFWLKYKTLNDDRIKSVPLYFEVLEP
jgi:hypothetical protein